MKKKRGRKLTGASACSEYKQAVQDLPLLLNGQIVEAERGNEVSWVDLLGSEWHGIAAPLESPSRTKAMLAPEQATSQISHGPFGV